MPNVEAICVNTGRFGDFLYFKLLVGIFQQYMHITYTNALFKCMEVFYKAFSFTRIIIKFILFETKWIKIYMFLFNI